MALGTLAPVWLTGHFLESGQEPRVDNPNPYNPMRVPNQHSRVQGF